MKDPKKVFYVMMGIFAAIILAGGGVFYLFDNVLSDKATHISELKAEDEVLEIKVRRGREVQRQLDELEFTKAIVDEVLPSSKEQSNLVGELISIEQSSGVLLERIAFPGSTISEGGDPDLSQTEELEEIGNVKILPVTTSFNCASFNQLVRFLQATEQNQRKMQVSNIDITRVNDSSSTCKVIGNIDVILTIEVYVTDV